MNVRIENGLDWVGTALNPVEPDEPRRDMLYVCEACRDDGKEFKVPVDEIGAVVMEQHLKSEHGVVALEWHVCPECGYTILCKLQRPPTSCAEHS